jgi:uncharacterized membrane protein
MSLVVDPISPWALLYALLTGAGPRALVPAVVVAAAGFSLPLLPALCRPGGWRRRWLVIAGVALAVGLVDFGREAWAGGGAVAARAGMPGVPMTLLAVLGGALLLLTPAALAGVTVWTYLGVPGASRNRVAAVLALRLLAFALVFLAVLRPSLGFSGDHRPRRQLCVALDYSRSMTIQDEAGKKSRWELAVDSLKKALPALDRLRQERRVDVVFSKFAGSVAELDPDNPGAADAEHTDIGTALRTLLERREGRTPVLGVLVLSDGTDHGTAVPAVGEAARWRALPSRVHTFACGKPTTTNRQNDVAITAISTRPTPFVPVKGKLTVKLTIDARGFENTKTRIQLFLGGKEEPAASQGVVLGLTAGNVVELTCDAPSKPGEIKVRATVDVKDDFPANNSIETFVNVSKDGISVLLADRPRDGEPQLIYEALRGDARIRVDRIWVGGAPSAAARRLFQFQEQPYDVILLGDVSAGQLRAIDPDALKKIERLVGGGAGLMMLGGYSSLGNGDWRGTELEPVLPVDLGARGQEEAEVRMEPTADGIRLAPFIMRLDAGDPKEVWGKLPKLNGMSLLRPRKGGTQTVLAVADGKEPLLVMQNYARRDGKGGGVPGRVLAFGGDTTYRWRMSGPEGLRLHSRFWRQVVVWLARQEDARGSVWVNPDVRRLPVRGELGFEVGLRGKGGGPDLKGGKYRVEVIDPDGARTPVPVGKGGLSAGRQADSGRGAFARTEKPGVYQVVVHGEGEDPAGGVVKGDASARVAVYDEDLELTRAAADHEFLRKLAAAGGGEYHRVEELAGFLNGLYSQPPDRGRQKLELWPDWRRATRSAFLVAFFLVFVAVVSAEWALRRRWALA